MGCLLIRLTEQRCAAVIPWGETKCVPTRGYELNCLTEGTPHSTRHTPFNSKQASSQTMNTVGAAACSAIHTSKYSFVRLLVIYIMHECKSRLCQDQKMCISIT